MLLRKTTDNRQRTTDHTSPFLEIDWNHNIIKTKLVGDYNYENVMAAIAVGTYFGVEENLIIEALENYVPSNNRSQFIRSKKNEIVMDAYNANPVSMYHAIKNFRNISDDNHLLIIGDMRELGCESINEHKEILNTINEIKDSFEYLYVFLYYSHQIYLPALSSFSELHFYGKPDTPHNPFQHFLHIRIILDT